MDEFGDYFLIICDKCQNASSILFAESNYYPAIVHNLQMLLWVVLAGTVDLCPPDPLYFPSSCEILHKVIVMLA